MTALVQHPYVQALAWTLVNFLWQGAAIAAVAFVLLRLTRDRATWQYAIGVAGLAVMLAVPVVTFVVLAGRSTSVSAGAVGAADLTAVNAALLATNQPAVSHGPAALPSAPVYQVIVIGVWLAGVTILSLRLFGGWVVARRLARRAIRPVGPDILALAARAAARLRLSRVVSIFESSLVSVPMLVGWIKPAVLLPAAALSGLSPDQIEALLAHELAHVMRHDYLVNLMQSGVETLLFYHPAVWWLSHEVREAREHCCDDLAVAASDRLVYATALADLASIVATPGIALAATDGSLVSRVRRVLGGSNEAPRTSLGWVPICGVLCIVGALIPTGFVSAEGKPATPATTAVEPARPDASVEATAAQVREVEVPAEAAPKVQLSAEALADLKKKIELVQRDLDDAKRRLEMQKVLEPEREVLADEQIAKIKQDQLKREYERTVQLYQKGLVTRDTLAQAETKLKLEQLGDESQRERIKAFDEALASLARTQKLFEVGLVSQSQLNEAMAAAKNRQEQTREAVKKALAEAEWSKSQFAKIQGEFVDTDFGPLSAQASALRDRVAFSDSPMSTDALAAVLKDAARIEGDADRAGVLIAVAERQALTPELVTLYATAAKGIRSDEIRAKVFAHPIRLKQVR
jgi:beta-lactamase regulating signal transducer with metallopeptidase domain